MKKVIAFFGVLAGCVALGALALFAWTMRDIPLERLEKIKPLEQRLVLTSVAELEKYSLVREKHLKNYLLFTSKKQKSISRLFLDQKIKAGLNGTLEIEEPVKIQPLVRNDCQHIYCFQHRVSFASIPSVLWKGLIGIEDNRFLNHRGVDPRSILRALWHDLKVMRLEQGGSTITQQLAKNLFYSNQKKFERKLREFIVSLYLEFKFSKEEILEAYFNEIEWGSLEGIKIKGIYSASLFYFEKKPSSLSAYESSILISLLKGPYFYHPLNHTDRLKGRAQFVFKKLKELKMLSRSERGWSDQDWEDWKGKLERAQANKFKRALYLAGRNASDLDSYSRYVFHIEALSFSRELKKRYPKAPIAIKSLWWDVSQADYHLKYYSSFERNLDNALEREAHQVGSTLKPVIYSHLLNEDKNLNTLVSTEPITLKLKSGEWSPRESHGGLPSELSVREALLQSLNRPLIRLAEGYGFSALEEKLKDSLPGLLTPLGEYPAQLLGAIELSLEDLLDLYVSFVGIQCDISEEQSILEALSDPSKTTVRKRVNPLLRQMKFFGKTGTSNNGLDNWFVAFDGKLLSVTWVGVERDRSQFKNLNLYGSNTSFLLYQNFMLHQGKRMNAEWCNEEL